MFTISHPVLFFIRADFDATEGYETDELIQRGGDPTGSSADAQLAASNRLDRLREVLGALEEFPQERRGAKREALLRAVFKGLTHHATGEAGWEVVAAQTAGIRTACAHSLRSGQSSASEQYAACRVLEAASVALGANEEDWVESIDKPLRRAVMATARAVPVRAAALRALSLSAVICAANDTVVGESLQDLCEAVAAPQYRNQAVPASLRAAALDCWALLATLQDDLHLAGQDDVQMGRGLALLELLKDCLDDPSVELRSAAGQCLALVHEARLHLGVTDDDSEAAANATARRYQQGSWEGSQFEVLMDEVRQRVAELSVESGHHLSKKAKKEQRATFREYMATIVDDEAPEQEIHFRSNGSLTLQTWKEIVQLNFVRHCLQSGFQIQLLTNATLQSMFGADGSILSLNSAGGMSQLEKRLVLSKTSEASKLADQDRRGRRDKREKIKQHFLMADGDDI